MVSALHRREFLKLIGATAGLSSAAAALAGCGSDSSTSSPAAGAPGTTSPTAATAASTGSRASTGSKSRTVNFGFIALTDSASLIMAKELGYFEERSIDAVITKQASWPALRDALQTGQIDAAHALYTVPFSVATKIGGNGATDLKIAIILSNNGQGLTLANEFEAVGYGDLTKAKGLFESASAPELAMTFPGGTHDLWLRYWLAACGVDASSVKIGAVPSPQMVRT